MEPSSTWLAERAELRCGEASLASLAEDECPAATLPPDALRNVLSRLDLPSRLAAACVCTEWRDACSDPSLWHTISVPEAKSFRLWDTEFAALVARCKGRLTRLHVSLSGITGKSLIRLIESRALAPHVEELHLDNCCNLKVCDILAFVQALAPSHAPPPSRTAVSSPTSRIASPDKNVETSQAQTLEDWSGVPVVRQRGLVARSSRGSPGSSKSTAAMGDVDVLKLCDVVPPPAPPCTIGSLRVAGCKGMGSWEVQQLQAAVGHLDVSLCRCGRVGVLQRCGATSPEAGPEARAAGRMASSLGSSPRAPEAGTIGGTASPSSSSPGSASPSSASGSLSPTHWGTAGTPQEGASTPAPRCPGLCSACSELFKGCGSNVCGACWEPRVAHQMQALRTRMRLWEARRESVSALRSRWTDIRHGVETTTAAQAQE